MMGLAGSLTPVIGTRAVITISGDCFNSTGVGDGCNIQLRYGTGTAPANGDALTGTLISTAFYNFVNASAGQKSPFSVTAAAVGLTPLTPIWIDLGLAATGGGSTANVENINIVAFEM